MVKQEIVGDTVVLRCDCGRKMRYGKRAKRYTCPDCGHEMSLSSLTPLQPVEPIATPPA